LTQAHRLCIWLKRILPRDFQLLVFFTNQFLRWPWISY
jgi:hypothetical protein